VRVVFEIINVISATLKMFMSMMMMTTSTLLSDNLTDTTGLILMLFNI